MSNDKGVENLWVNPPAEFGLRLQLSIRFDFFSDQEGGCAVTVGAPPQSEMVAKYGGMGRALAACRENILKDLDSLIEEFFDER